MWIRQREIEIDRGIIEQALAVLVGVSGCGVIQKVTANYDILEKHFTSIRNQ